ncbi:MAG: hypothetical protein ACK4HW_08380 [Roseinatronobacter sp.]
MRRILLISMMVISASQAAAQGFESMQKASNLGTVIASEQQCGLSFDQDAIEAWIDENTDPSDMSFAGNLQMMIQGSQYNTGSLSGSALTAHCRAVERTSRHFGFIQ